MKMLIPAIALLSTTAMAMDYKINMEGRADFVNANVKTTTGTTAATTVTQKYNNFNNNLVRMNLMGKVNDSLSFRVRYRMINAPANPATAGAREVTASSLDMFYIDHTNSFFTTRIGKTNWAEAYGRESVVAGTDVFLVSDAATVYKGASFGTDYRFGATAMFKFLDTNNLSIALSNPNSTFSDLSGAEQKNTGIAFGAYYTGSFLNKMVQPLLAYTNASQNGDADNTTVANKTKDVNNTMMNVGLRSEVAGFVIDADYKEAKTPSTKFDAHATAGTVNTKTKSVYANVAYSVADFTPMVTYINDKFTSDTATAQYKKNSFAVGTYWKPMADVGFRYHVMYTSSTKKFDAATTGTAKVVDNRLYVGFKADI